MDFSAGIIPYRLVQNDLLFLIIQQVEGHWSFPKGHPINDETGVQTAQRELYEETGLFVSHLDKEFSCMVRYGFTERGETIKKEVLYYLGLVREPSIRLDSSEVTSYAWLSYEQAMSRLTFLESQYALQEAATWLEEKVAPK